MIEIKDWGGRVLFSGEYETLAETLCEAVKGGANLRGAYLGGAYLEGANLRGAYLGGAYLGGAYLEGAYLRGAYLRGANLRGANLRGANLEGANLGGANLEGANLRGAYLEGANLRGAYLEGANYGDGIPLSLIPIGISGLRWFVLILDKHLKVGCELHSFEKWKEDGDEIARKHTELKWWKQHKDMIFSIIQALRPPCGGRRGNDSGN